MKPGFAARRVKLGFVLAAMLLMSACSSTALHGAGTTSPSPSAPATSPAATTSAPAPVTDAGSIPTKYPPAAEDPSVDIASALTASRRDGRPVLLDFGADWCPDCVVLDRLYHSAAASAVLDSKYHLVLVDVGQFDTNLRTAAEYIDLRRSGIPALVVLRPDGSIAYRSNDGAFANARTMTAGELVTFLRRWSGA